MTRYGVMWEPAETVGQVEQVIEAQLKWALVNF
jgi:hypothetical protein